MEPASKASDRRRAILEATLACFLERGYLGTSIADIRARSGASTGSIYHFFGGKPDLAQTLLRDAVTGWAAATTRHADAESDIKASVRGLVVWGLGNPAQLRLMDELRGLALTDPALAGVRRMLADGQAAGAARYAAMQAEGAVRALPFSVAHALMLGPAYSYMRLAPPTPPGEAERLGALFAEAAWQAVKAP